MASGAPKRKRLSHVSAPRVKQAGKEKLVPWEHIAPRRIAAWLGVYAKANNTSREILFASILPTVACLMGETTIKVDCRLKPEQINLIVVCLSEPGSGKSPAFQNGCSQPIRLHVEEQASTTLFVDEFTEAGLFQQLKTSLGHKAIIGKEEVSQFFEPILHGLKDKGRVDVERLIQLYDGATWVYTKGDKSSRQLVQNPGVSIVGYSQPERFFPLYRKLKGRRDGLVDRMLIYQPMPRRLTSAETKGFIANLGQCQLRDLRLVYQNIFTFSHKENEVITFTMDHDANKAFEDFVDTIAETLNKQWAENRCNQDVSKDDRHVLRLAAIMHVLYDQLEKQLDGQRQNSPPPPVVTAGTIKRAIKLANYFAEQRKVLDQLDDNPTEQEEHNATETVATAVLKCSGPFSTVRLSQSVLSGKKRPVASTVVEIMGNLEKDGLGKVLVVDRTTVFYKCLPINVKDEVLTVYSVNAEEYNMKFKERAPLNHISKELFNKLLDKAPEKEELKTTYDLLPEV